MLMREHDVVWERIKAISRMYKLHELVGNGLKEQYITDNNKRCEYRELQKRRREINNKIKQIAFGEREGE
jgi:hypothetical protein